MKILFIDGPYDGRWVDVYNKRKGEPPYHYRVANSLIEEPMKTHNYESVSFIDADRQKIFVFRYVSKEGENKRKPIIQTLVNGYAHAKETSTPNSDTPELDTIDAPFNSEGNIMNALFLGGPYDGRRMAFPRKPKPTFEVFENKGYPENSEWPDATRLTRHQYDLSELTDTDNKIVYVYCYWPPEGNRIRPIATLLEGYQRKVA